MKLSIIIPVYNAQKYLAECLSSLVNQDLIGTDYEIIVINDGSKDNSKEIIASFKEKYNNIIFIDQDNQGVAVARNAGLKIANGTFITFVDADDFIEVNSLKTIIERADEQNLDILYLSLKAINEKGEFLNNFDAVGQDFVVKTGVEHSRRTYPPTIYKKSIFESIVESIVFPLHIPVGEDTVFNALVQSKATRCSYCSLPYYNYRLHNESASRANKSEVIFNGFINAISEIIGYRDKNFQEITKLEKNYFDAVIIIFIDRIMDWFVIAKLENKHFVILKQILEKNKLDYLITDTARKYKFFDKTYFSFWSYHFARKGYFNFRNILKT